MTRAALSGTAQFAFRVLLLAILSPAAQAITPAPASAIAHVSIFLIAQDRELHDQTVLTSHGVITAVGASSKLRIPAGSTVVDGRGRWLMPGMADMHSHVHTPEGLQMMLKYGVTTILDMGGGDADFYALRDAVRDSRTPGPTILTAFKIDGPGDEGSSAAVPANATEARVDVDRAKTEGFDFVKVYSRLAPAIFDAIADQARRRDMAVIGHAVRSVTLEHSFAAGQVMVAHSEEFLAGFGDAPPDERKIPELVEQAKRYGVTVTANLDGIQRIAAQWSRPEVTARYVVEGASQGVPRSILAKWLRASYPRLPGSYDAEAAFATKLVSALHTAGVRIIAGTDAPDVPGIAPGIGLHNELDALRRAGFSNAEALAAATWQAGAFVARYRPNLVRFGSIEPGMRADLLLLDGDPRLDFDVVHTPRRVMAAGRWVF